MNGKLAAWATVVALLALMAFGLASHLVCKSLDCGTLNFESGEYRADRYVTLGVASTTVEYGFHFVDPINKTDKIFYNFFPYWVMGFVAKITNSHIWSVANIFHLVYCASIVFVLYVLAFHVLKSRAYSLFSVLLTFSYWHLSGFITDTVMYGNHAQILTFLEQTYGPYSDSHALLFGYLALVFLVRYLKTPNYSSLLLFGLLTVFAILFHMLPGIYFIALFFAIISISHVVDKVVNEKISFWYLLLIGCVLAAYAYLLHTSSYFLPNWLIAVFAAGLFSLQIVFFKDRKPYLTIALSVLPAVAMIAVNLSSLDVEDYNEVIRLKNLALPPLVYFGAYAPIWILSICSLLKEKFSLEWAISVSIVIVSIVFIFNDTFGYNNHPYRFVPYSFPLLCIISMRGIQYLLSVSEKTVGYVILSMVAFLLVLGVEQAYDSDFMSRWFTNDECIDGNKMELADYLNGLSSNDVNVFIPWDMVGPFLPLVRKPFYGSSKLSHYTATWRPPEEYDEEYYIEDVVEVLVRHCPRITHMVFSRGRAETARCRDCLDMDVVGEYVVIDVARTIRKMPGKYL